MKKLRKKLLKLLKQNTKTEVLVFFLKLIVFSLPILLIINLNCYCVQNFIVNIVSFLLNLFNIPHTVFDTLSTNLNVSPAIFLKGNGTVVVIDWACTGVRSFYLMIAIFLSLPKSYKNKIKTLLIGSLILFAVNIFRIFLLIVCVVNTSISPILENVLWSTLLNITVFAVVISYVVKQNGYKKK